MFGTIALASAFFKYIVHICCVLLLTLGDLTLPHPGLRTPELGPLSHCTTSAQPIICLQKYLQCSAFRMIAPHLTQQHFTLLTFYLSIVDVAELISIKLYMIYILIAYLRTKTISTTKIHRSCISFKGQPPRFIHRFTKYDNNRWCVEMLSTAGSSSDWAVASREAAASPPADLLLQHTTVPHTRVPHTDIGHWYFYIAATIALL